VRCAACPADRLCSSCRDQVRAWNASSAVLAGRRWGGELRRQWPRRRWPAWEESPALQAAARARVAELAAGDPELVEEFARACAAAGREAFYFPELRAGTVVRPGDSKREQRLRHWGPTAVARAERDGYRGAG
jgi:hypothetical protein